ncbi:hypothetical protein D5E84_19215 [Vibrio parahaemolyticus]|nr:hypothetical protein D5E84_19215 [Vibrio parahaemolyticus]
MLDLLGFLCAQNRHAMNHIWTMGEILRRIKRAYWSEKKDVTTEKENSGKHLKSQTFKSA